MALETVSFLDRKYCINSTVFSGEYHPNKIYVGRSRNLRRNVFVNIEFRFKTQEEMKEFFDWWMNETDSGGRPFYATLPLYATTAKDYLILQFDAFKQKVNPYFALSAKFMLFQNKTLDEKSPPIAYDMNATFWEGSKNNVLQLDGYDPDGDAVQFTLSDSAGNDIEASEIYPYETANGTKAYVRGGAIIIAVARDYIGTDVLYYKVFDGLYYSQVAAINITTQARGKELLRVTDENDSSVYEEFRVEIEGSDPLDWEDVNVKLTEE